MEKLPVHRPLPLGGIADQRSSAGSDFTSFAFKVAFVKVYVTEMLEILENFLIFFIEIFTVQHTSATFVANQISMYVFLFIFYLFCVLLCFQLKNFKATDSQLTLV